MQSKGFSAAPVTVLNWTGAPQDVRVRVRLPFAVGAVTAVKAGSLKHTAVDGAVSVALHVDAADIVMIVNAGVPVDGRRPGALAEMPGDGCARP